MAMKQAIIKKLRKTEIYESNEAYLKVLYWFFSFPNDKVGLNDLSADLKIAKTTASKVVSQLVEEGFLIKEDLGNVWRISCNQVKDNNYTYSRKIGYNLIRVYESGILNSIHEVIKNSRAIILFGSYRKGDDTEKSDMDIAVEILGDEDIKIYQLGILPELGYRKNVPVNLHVFSRNKIDLNLFANIANGIVLEGFLEVRP